jgi:predicted RNA methylase
VTIAPFDPARFAFHPSPERLSSVAVEELKALRWWYGLPLAGPVKLEGKYDPTGQFHNYLLNTVHFRGKSVLVLGCRDGFFMFLAEALGASSVVGIDAPYERDGINECFSAAKEILGATCTTRDGDLESLDPEEIGVFDVVLLFEVTTRSDAPRRVVESACRVCRETLVVMSHFLPTEEQLPHCATYRSYTGEKDHRDRCAPNASWFRHVLEEEHFKIVGGTEWHDFSRITVVSAKQQSTAPRLTYQDMPLDTGFENETAVLVMSCERYSQAWDFFFALFWKYWPECPYKVYLCTDKGNFVHEKVSTISIGTDRGWANNFRHALDVMGASRVILTLEDFFPNGRWDDQKIRKLVMHARQFEVGCLRFYACPGPTGRWYGSEEVGTIGPTDPYRVSTMNAVWSVDTLRGLLSEGMNPWQFELIGSRLAATRIEPFLSVWDHAPGIMSYYATGITKGRWEEGAIRLLAQEGFATDHIRLKV